MKKSNLTLVICVYNGGEYIGETLESIEKQTRKKFNILIINDCSTDNTLDIVKKYSEKSCRGPYKVISLEINKGLANARYIAEQEVSTEYMIFVDADDILKPNMLEKLSKKIEKDSDLIAVGCYVEYIDSKSKKIGGGIFLGETTKEGFYKKAKSEKLIFMHPAAILRKEAVLAVGSHNLDGFPEGKPRYQDYCEDLDLWTRMSDLYVEGKAIVVLPEVLYQYRKMDNTVSSNTLGMMMRMKHIKKNLKRRRRGDKELSYIEFEKTLSFKEKEAIEKEVNSATAFRKAAFKYKDGKNFSAISGVLKATLINPKYVLKKVLPIVKRKTNTLINGV